ncbi:MAG: uroporphyrinogen-III synthase [Planctomycetota bacterium]
MGVLPLEGSRWILTRPRERASSWRVALEENGAEVVLSPAILLRRGPSEPVLQSLDGLPGGSLFIFTSATTVRHFFTMINPSEHDALRSMEWIAVGPATADAIREAGFEVSVEGDGSGADSLCSQLLSEIKCGSAIHFTSDLGLPIVSERLTAAGIDVMRVEVSRSQVEDDLDPNSWSDGQKKPVGNHLYQSGIRSCSGFQNRCWVRCDAGDSCSGYRCYHCKRTARAGLEKDRDRCTVNSGGPDPGLFQDRGRLGKLTVTSSSLLDISSE